MIKLERPSMAINDPRCDTKYQAWNTWYIQATETREHILEWTRKVAVDAPGGKLKNLIIHCHGSPGRMMLGQGFDRSNVGMFTKFNEGGTPVVEKIWLHVCEIAKIGTAGGASDGNLFCSALAKSANCYVVASNLVQSHKGSHTYPPDQIDSFEGLVMSYGPEGNVTWSSRYGDWNSNKE
ncbi:hypothetical protein [Methylobacterium crusticola]|uniref:hypothetical protein n=1 Tax=Methylobacterium crusticola TaxID=1697972 RepID=UPI000FFC3C95|nr:hypothetical protein [Methylobacterium crusticola]